MPLEFPTDEPHVPASHELRLGLERFLSQAGSAEPFARWGLLANQASVTGDLTPAWVAIEEAFPGRLKALFSPQHGLWSEQQANMIESPHGQCDFPTVPVFSLYSETRRPTAAMLEQIDCLLIDMQDVGTRVYTFVWTAWNCLLACAESRKPVIVLDRPNPLGGVVVEGPPLDMRWSSFVGLAPAPMRHGLTIGELLTWMAAEQQLPVDLRVIPLQGWQPAQLFGDLGRPWIPTSPNLPGWESCLLYPGMVLLEGTSLSEGRGTCTPFALLGSPQLPAQQLSGVDTAECAYGIRALSTRFCPVFDKWQGESCAGVRLLTPSPSQVRSFAQVVHWLSEIQALSQRDKRFTDFQWLCPPYEYEYDKPPIDILFGSDRLRVALHASSGPLSSSELEDLWQLDQVGWWNRVERWLLYPRPAAGETT